mmetsp:Transcript_50114/g.119273  ORF Transcript_50114/g.119273 Transcript_50114/m.119273 type:complete len:284 (-) Transcript_50114:36-887(-)
MAGMGWPFITATEQTQSQKQEGKKRLEESLETFLSRLPAWRGGQRDAGRAPDEPHESRSRSRGRRKEKEREKEKDKGKKDKDKDKDRDKDKKRGKSRDRDRDRDRDRAKEKDRDKDDRKGSPKRASRSRDDPPRQEAAVAVPPTQPAAQAPPPAAACPGASGEAGANVPDWLSDLVPKEAGSAAGLPAGVAALAPRREVMIPQQYVSRLIGRGGEVIMAICHQTGADVRIRQDTKEMGYSIAVITGTPDTAAQAEAMVVEKLSSVGVRLVPAPGNSNTLIPAT